MSTAASWCVSTNLSDRRESVADVDAASVGTVKGALPDNGYATGSEVAQLEQRRHGGAGGDDG